MQLVQLEKIIGTADEKAIKSELKRLGYIDCAKDRRYKYISLVTLYNGNIREVGEILFDNNTGAVDGAIITDVQGYEQTEFIEVFFYRIQPTVFDEEEKTAIEEHALIWAKEI